MITLVKDTIDNKDIDELIGWLQTYPRLTKGPLTLELEKVAILQAHYDAVIAKDLGIDLKKKDAPKLFV